MPFAILNQLGQHALFENAQLGRLYGHLALVGAGGLADKLVQHGLDDLYLRGRWELRKCQNGGLKTERVFGFGCSRAFEGPVGVSGRVRVTHTTHLDAHCLTEVGDCHASFNSDLLVFLRFPGTSCFELGSTRKNCISQILKTKNPNIKAKYFCSPNNTPLSDTNKFINDDTRLHELVFYSRSFLDKTGASLFC